MSLALNEAGDEENLSGRSDLFVITRRLVKVCLDYQATPPYKLVSFDPGVADHIDTHLGKGLLDQIILQDLFFLNSYRAINATPDIKTLVKTILRESRPIPTYFKNRYNRMLNLFLTLGCSNLGQLRLLNPSSLPERLSQPMFPKGVRPAHLEFVRNCFLKR